MMCNDADCPINPGSLPTHRIVHDGEMSRQQKFMGLRVEPRRELAEPAVAALGDPRCEKR